MSNDTNVVNLALVAQGDPSELGKAVAEMRTRMPALLEYRRMMAKVQRQAYLAYLDEGFTHQQALELAKDVRL